MSGRSVVPASRKPSVEMRRSRSSWSLSDAQSAASILRMVSSDGALSRPRAERLANTVMLGSVRASRVRQSVGLVPWRARDGALAIANFF